jgi:hypothetical protein
MLAPMSYLGVQPPRPIRLSIGASAAAKVFAVIVGIIGVSFAAFFVGVTTLGGSLANRASDMFGSSGVPDPSVDPVGGMTDTVSSAFRLFGLCAVPIAAVFIYVVLSTLRRAAWLDGTTAVVRGAFTTKRVDLSTATVQGDSVRYRQAHGDRTYIYTVPALAARDRTTGRQIKIPLRGMGLKRLPAGELVALADAMMAGRRPSDPDYGGAAALADSMRQMAANPFPV